MNSVSRTWIPCPEPFGTTRQAGRLHGHLSCPRPSCRSDLVPHEDGVQNTCITVARPPANQRTGLGKSAHGLDVSNPEPEEHTPRIRLPAPILGDRPRHMRIYTVHGRSSERYPESGCPSPSPGSSAGDERTRTPGGTRGPSLEEPRCHRATGAEAKRKERDAFSIHGPGLPQQFTPGAPDPEVRHEPTTVLTYASTWRS